MEQRDSAFEEEAELFRAYRSTGDRRLRDSLVKRHYGLAIALARRYQAKGESMDDLAQVALLGLFKAVQRFDPERGVPFVGFATPTIHGEIRRYFRDSAWAMKVPRSLKELHLRLRPTVAELRLSLQRSPTVAELAEHLGVTQELVLQAMEAGASYRPSSIDEDSRDDGTALTERLTKDEPGFAHVDSRETVQKLLTTLSGRSRRILELRYFEDLTQAEIAHRVGISQMHVSRLLRQALTQLAEHADDSGETG